MAFSRQREIPIPYGTGTMPLHVEESRLRAVLEPAVPETSEEPAALVRRALAAPIGSPPLHELAVNRKRALVITSDHTRPIPSAVTLPLLLEEIRKGSPEADITILVASGLHRAMTEEEMLKRFGYELLPRERFVVHDAHDGAGMAYFGRLPSGGELYLNRLAAEADLVVSEGFIEPHFFAGYSGGRKSILPGIASDATIRWNHNAGFIADPRAWQGRLHDNPIHRDMAFAAEAARLAFILNVLLDESKQITAAFAGDPAAAHEAGCLRCGQLARVPAVQADIVVTSNGGYPLDQNIYQCVKGMTAAEACVRPGGAVILCAALGDGHGGEAFWRWFHDRPDAAAVAGAIENIPKHRTLPDQWQAQILARVMGRANCWLVTGERDRELVEGMHLRWAKSADAALEEATRLLGERSDVTVIPNGVNVIVSSGGSD